MSQQQITDNRDATRGAAFSILELMVVVAILILVVGFLPPAMTSLKSSGDVTNAADTIKGVLEQARTYAMANNTYTWVGFYEESSSAASPTNVAPPYTGAGRVLLATVYSTDGTKIFENTDTSASLPAAQIKPVNKLIRIEGIHLTDVGAPPSPTPSPSPLPNSLYARSGLPYLENASPSPAGDHYNRINSESSDKTKFNFTVQNYTFYKTVRFSPRGEANINSTYDLRHVAEIALRPTHGSVVDTSTTNVVAIQFGGSQGNFRVYRR